MKFDAAFVLFAVSLLTIALLHNVALQSSLYWIYPWFDMPMHFLGGAVVAFGFLTVGIRFIPARLHSFGATLAAVLAVGVAWEIFEWSFGLTEQMGYAQDTVVDLCLDMLGGLLAYYLTRSLRKVGM